MKLPTSDICLVLIYSLYVVRQVVSTPIPAVMVTDRNGYKFDINAYDMSRIHQLAQISHTKNGQPRSIVAFVTDPALLVTILHSLELAYWTMPFGFVLTPIINLFRMPNRRLDVERSGQFFENEGKLKELYQALKKAIEKIEKIPKTTNVRSA